MQVNRQTLRATAAALILGFVSNALLAATPEEVIAPIQTEWAEIKYNTPEKEQADRYQTLAKQSRTIVEGNPGAAEPLIWEGIVLSSWAGEKGGLGALNLAKQAKALYERALQIDATALDGSAYNSLGVLYYKVPGWPIGFGDKDKARDLLQKALAINPNGIDPNYFYADFLVQTEEPQKAVAHLEKALQAPARAGRAVADEGRRTEVRQLLDKVKGK